MSASPGNLGYQPDVGCTKLWKRYIKLKIKFIWENVATNNRLQWIKESLISSLQKTPGIQNKYIRLCVEGSVYFELVLDTKH